jgi:hypothetical protein
MKHQTCFGLKIFLVLSGWLMLSGANVLAQGQKFEITLDQGCNFSRKDLSDSLLIPISRSGNEPKAQWRHFWEFGDGFYRITTDSLLKRDSSTGVLKYIRVNSVPTYSGNDKPNIARLTGVSDCGGQNSGSVDNFLPEDTLKLKAEINWNAAQAGDTMTMAVSFRGENPQLLRLKVVAGKIALAETDNIRRTTGIELTDWPHKNKGILQAEDTHFWRLDNLGSAASHTIFMDFTILSSVGDDMVKIELDLLPIPAENPMGGISTNSDVSIVNLLVGNQEQQVRNPSSIYHVRADTEARADKSIIVNVARDPNRISVSPLCVEHNRNKHKLFYKVEFENLGTGNANFLSVEAVVDTVFLDINSLSDFEYQFESNNALKINDSIVNGRLLWSFEKGDKQIAPLLSNQGGSGWLSFSIETHERKFRHGEQIIGQAHIKMGDSVRVIHDSVWTNLAITNVSRRCRFCLPAYWGIKGGMNYQNADFSNFTEGGGWHAGISWRRALTCLPPEYRFSKSIPGSRMPRYWYQAELMLNRLGYTEADNDSYRYWMLDVVPLQIRYLLGSVGGSLNNRIAVSGGYRLSFCADARVNGNRASLEGGRFEHGLFSDVAVLNIIGKPGLSLGWRYHHRLNQVLPTEVGNYFQVYVHLNL